MNKMVSNHKVSLNPSRKGTTALTFEDFIGSLVPFLSDMELANLAAVELQYVFE